MKEKQEDLFSEVESVNKNVAKLRKLERKLDMKSKMKKWQEEQNAKTQRLLLEENPNLVNLREDKKDNK